MGIEADDMRWFTLSGDFDISDLERALPDDFALETDAERPFCRTYLDTFDRRIAEAGEEAEPNAVEWDVQGDEGVVRYVDADGREPSAVYSADQPPRFAEDLPPGRLREALAPLLGLRALLPMLQLRGRAQHIRVLDGESKTVVHLLRLGVAVTDAESQGAVPLDPVLQLRGLRGYRREAKRVARALSKVTGQEPGPSLLERGFAAIGRDAFGHASGPAPALDPEMPAQRALREVLLALSATIRANEPGVRARLDTEFLHDLRVAVRRTRSALQRFRGVLPEREMQKYAAAFARVGAATGVARDLDVHLLEFDEHAARLDAASRAQLAPLHELLHEERDAAHVELLALFDHKSWPRLLDAWEAWLRHEPRRRELLADGARPIAVVASERAADLHAKLLRRGGRITDDTPAEALHDLRKLAKKLRYSLELFAEVFPRSAYRPAVRALKVLQENLGDFQDYEVQQTALSVFGAKLMRDRRAPAETLLVMGRILDDLARRQQATREEFGRSFGAFASQASRDSFAALLAKSKKHVASKKSKEKSPERASKKKRAAREAGAE